jgi:UDP-3-O-[3-hydroxymyristoyl] glucosamine N-acyltransferase
LKKTLRELADWVDGQVCGDESIEIEGITGIDEAGPSDLTFAVLPHLDRAAASGAAAVIIPQTEEFTAKPAIRVANPRVAFTRLLNLFNPPPPVVAGVHPTAVVGSNVTIGNNVSVMAQVFIGDDVVIGDGTTIYPQAYLGNGTIVGQDCLIHPRVTLREKTQLGDRVIIQSGAVLGGDGFGYVTVDGEHLKVPQVGNVVIENDVEIGANTAIDRATTGSTIVKRGTKIDNLVHLAHNDVIGEHCFIVAQTGISGSVTVGDRVTLAGQTGTAGHIKIGANSVFIGRAGITKDTPENYFGAGTPARPHQEWLREQIALHKLPETMKKIRNMEKRLIELEEKKQNP